MQEIIDGIVQVGILPVIIGYLLFDQSKKMEAMRAEMIKMNLQLAEIAKAIESCKK
jgi:hypothetical protein